MTELPFVRVGGYDLVRRLGAGGMGEVYLAHDSRLERDVAIKLLPAELSRDPEALARFRREALTLAALNHPNIATIHGFEDTPDGGLGLVLEYVQGESLAARLERGAMPIHDALSACAQIAEALEVAHERGIVHRDLKPGNVMLAPRGIVKVLDFGLAKRAPGLLGLREKHSAAGATVTPGPVAGPAQGASSAHDPITMGGAVVGTPGYMSPEQVLAGEQDERTDVFAFGCVLYEALSGRRAFPGRDVWEIMAKVLNDTPDRAALPERLPPRVRTLLDRCLARAAPERLRDIQVARHELEEVLGTRRASALRAGELAGTANNLPLPLTSFVGREQELERCRRELGSARLLTLLGMGGSGKTRLALRVAEAVLDEHPDGVWFADLGVLQDPGRVLETVAAAAGVREEPGTPLEQTLTEQLRERRVLLLMDNCEHVLAGCRPLLTRLLAACRELRVLATSRESLGLAGEHVHAVPPLGIPSGRAGEDPGASEAVQLFVARAAQVRSDFTLVPATARVVAEICRRLDGIPLALELAAARVRVLGVEKILARLGDRFRLLTATGSATDARHQTLRAVIQWSADQLAEEELRSFRALSVFVGAWSLESAVAVCGEGLDEFEVLDILQRLADQSLVMLARDAGGEARYHYLESVRHLATELLVAAGEDQACRDRHLDWFLGVAERSQEPLAGAGQKPWLVRLDLEHEDVLAAHAWSAGRAGGAQSGLRLAAAMARYWSTRGHYGLARRTLDESLERAQGTAAGPVRAIALVRSAGFALYQGDYEAARPLLEQSLALYRDANDEPGVARALSGLATVATYQRDYATARACYEETLESYRRRGERHAMAIALHNLGFVSMRVGDLTAARGRYEEAVRLFEGTGDDRHLGHTRGELGLACTRLGDTAAARPHLAAAVRLSRDLGAQREAAYALESAAELASTAGEDVLALRWLGASAALRERIGTTLLPAEHEEQDARAAGLRERLGGAPYEAARGQGRLLPLEEVLESALVWLEAAPPVPASP